MKKSAKVFCGALALCTALGTVGCMRGDDAIKITVWVSEADRSFATQVANDFQATRPDKKYNFVIDIQGENDVATRVLNDVENAADVYSCSNDQLSKLVNGDALAQIAGERLNLSAYPHIYNMNSFFISSKQLISLQALPFCCSRCSYG